MAGIPIEKLFGPAVVVDLEKLGVGDFDLYGPEHFEEWERRTGIRIQPGDILIHPHRLPPLLRAFAETRAAKVVGSAISER